MNMRPDPLLRQTRDDWAFPATALMRHPVALPDSAPLHDARRLTEGGVQARIALDGQVYALRITRAGKLILTK